jgi:hypothetical protein
MATLFCSSGQEAYPVYAVSKTRDEDYHWEIELTDEEAAFVLQSQEDEGKAHDLICAALERSEEKWRSQALGHESNKWQISPPK